MGLRSINKHPVIFCIVLIFLLNILQPHGVLSHCVKNGLEIESRATNDLEHFCSRGLLFTCLVKLSSKPCDHILSRAGSSPEALNRITAWHFRSSYSTMATHRRPRDAQDGRS